MCGRFLLYHQKSEIVARFKAAVAPSSQLEFVPRYNIAPTQNVLTVQEDGERYMETMLWGMHLPWMKETNRSLINVRAETLVEKPFFRKMLEHNRCILTASGFYEWKSDGKKKTPIFFHPADDGIVGIGGVWSEYESSEGVKVRSCAIITTEPNELVGEVHNRMPLVLSREGEDLWLNPSTPLATLQTLLVPAPSSLFEAREVNDTVNKTNHDSPDCIVQRKSKPESLNLW